MFSLSFWMHLSLGLGVVRWDAQKWDWAFIW